MRRTSQRGVGLVEVLVALLILALGILGFIVLQYRAVEATAESGSRVHAINLARDLAERIRVNRDKASVYESQLNTAANQRNFSKNCYTQGCDADELADFDVAKVVERARSIGMTINYTSCPENNDGRKCVYVAWGETVADHGEEEGDGSCTITTNSGISYDPESTCLIMEAYS
ncbi:type IV pilus modification protein PilV [Acinetobacter pseudolwoffii]|uniref:type IV pilus modification protein PilV n=1 Tax=Acinetobacter pseudolwoffii TaxID=2053287 RepID=UPI003989F0F4